MQLIFRISRREIIKFSPKGRRVDLGAVHIDNIGIWSNDGCPRWIAFVEEVGNAIEIVILAKASNQDKIAVSTSSFVLEAF